MLALLPALVALALGRLAGTHSSLCSNETVHEHADWTGTDILPSNKPLYTHSAAECCAACANHTTKGTAPCLFWSRFTNKQGRCFLKTTATDRHSSSAMEAGSLPGAPLPPVGPPPGPAPRASAAARAACSTADPERGSGWTAPPVPQAVPRVCWL
jgi:hypothetical protein